MFRTSKLHLQERSYALCCNLVCLDTSCCYEGEGRTASSSSFTLIKHTVYERSWRWTIEVRNMLSYWMLWIKLIIKYCVSCWITDIEPCLFLLTVVTSVYPIKIFFVLYLHSCALLCVSLLLSSTHTDSLTVLTLYINRLEQKQTTRFTLRMIPIQAVYTFLLRSEQS